MGKLAYNAAKVHHRNIHLRSNAPMVLLLHGFPECWYSWRYQMDDLHKAGYHVLASDLRGYGRSDAPKSPDQYTSFQFEAGLFMTHPLNLQGGDSIKDIFKEGDGKLPPYVTEEDLKYYTEQFERSGFTGPVNYYRAMDRTWELKAPWTHVKVETPMLYVAGDKDVAVEFPGADEFLKGGGLKALTPGLQDAVLLEGCHFIHQEQAKQFNEIVIKFLK